MDFKKIKNYIVLAVIIFGGLISLWNQFIPETESQQLTLVNEEVLINDDESAEAEVEAEAILNEAESKETESLIGSESEKLENEAYESIKNYPDVRVVVWLDDLDMYIYESYMQYDYDGWNGLVDGQSTGTKAGGRWGNYDDQLPEYDSFGEEITYKEFDVNDKISGQSRDAQRFVVGSDGSVYLTIDHYDTYAKVIK